MIFILIKYLKHKFLNMGLTHLLNNVKKRHHFWFAMASLLLKVKLLFIKMSPVKVAEY